MSDAPKFKHEKLYGKKFAISVVANESMNLVKLRDAERASNAPQDIQISVDNANEQRLQPKSHTRRSGNPKRIPRLMCPLGTEISHLYGSVKNCAVEATPAEEQESPAPPSEAMLQKRSLRLVTLVILQAFSRLKFLQLSCPNRRVRHQKLKSFLT